jgi:hypothetical protein
VLERDPLLGFVSITLGRDDVDRFCLRRQPLYGLKPEKLRVQLSTPRDPSAKSLGEELRIFDAALEPSRIAGVATAGNKPAREVG